MNESLTPRSRLQHLDALLLVILTIARIRIDTLAEAAVLPLRQADVARHPWLGSVLPIGPMSLLAQQGLVDPLGLLLIVLAVGCVLAYLLIHEFLPQSPARYRWKLALIWAVVFFTVFLPSLKLMLLRQNSGPASYSHDGGVIQTEVTIEFLLSGRNPYVENYLDTPMADWGIDAFRTALYHYPYLPWTFVFSAPFQLLSQCFFGWYDQRLVYLLLFGLMLALLPRLARTRRDKLLLVMAIGLNPIMGSDLIYGQNDSFVLAWIVLSLWLWARGRQSKRQKLWGWGAAGAYGLACASKPTAWFLAPFFVVLMADGDLTGGIRWPWAWIRRVLRVLWPAAFLFVLIVGPYVVWNPAAMYDDVWRWSSGTSETAYQIWGWGFSNFLLAFGVVKSRFEYWPFWAPELIVGVPLLIGLLRQQIRDNTPARVCWNYGVFLLAFFFVSRFLNENYLGYILAFLVLGTLVDSSPDQELHK